MARMSVIGYDSDFSRCLLYRHYPRYSGPQRAIPIPWCQSAWGPDADRRAKLLTYQAVEGSILNLGGLFTLTLISVRRPLFANGLHSATSVVPRAPALVDGTLEECIREFMAKPTTTRHLYEILTAPQPPLVSAVLSGEHIVELARLRDFL